MYISINTATDTSHKHTHTYMYLYRKVYFTVISFVNDGSCEVTAGK